MAKTKYAKLDENGNVILNIDLVCKDWKHDEFCLKFYISEYMKQEDYDLIINTSKGRHWRISITKEQLNEIVKRKNLIYVKCHFDNTSGWYYSEERIHEKIIKAQEAKEEREKDIEFLNKELNMFKKALKPQ